jgi:hypothetical protein
LRAKITAAGYGSFNRRSVIISHAAGDERQRVLPDTHGDKWTDRPTGYLWTTADGMLMKEMTSEACVNYFEFNYKKIRKPKKKPAGRKTFKRHRKKSLTFANCGEHITYLNH